MFHYSILCLQFALHITLLTTHPHTHTQAIFMSAIPSSHKRLWEAAVKKLFALWRSKPNFARNTLSTLISGESSLFSLSLLAVLVEFLSKNGGIEAKEQEGMLSLFSKVVLSARNKPLQLVIVSSGPVFKHTSRAQFSSLLLPGTLKCLLRNPDELLEGEHILYLFDCDLRESTIILSLWGHPKCRSHSMSHVFQPGHLFTFMYIYCHCWSA